MSSIIFIQATPKTPYLYFNLKQGIFECRGMSYPDNSVEFYKPIVDKLDEFSETHPDKSLKASFHLYIFNNSSSKCLLDVFKKMEAHAKNPRHPTVNVIWYYNEDDNEMAEAGKDYQSILKIPLEIVQLQEYNEWESRVIKESEKSPSVSFEREKGILEIKGISTLENTIEFYEPLLLSIDSFVWKNRDKPYTIRFEIESCNPSSMEYFLQILSIFNTCKDVFAIWCYNQENEEIYTLGNRLKSELKYDFDLVQM